MIQFLKRRWVYHTIIWIALFLALIVFVFFTEDSIDGYGSFILEHIMFFIPIIITSYLGFWAKAEFFDKRKYLAYTLAAVGVVLVGVASYEGLSYIDGRLENSPIRNIPNFLFIQAFAVGLQYFKRGIINQYQLQELRAKTALAELNALKAQMNPHFLFNTLNNIYGMNQVNPGKGSDMIMEMSDVMRYHLEFSKEGRVRLGDEIKLLKSYIKLEQLRLRDTCDVDVDFTQVDENKKVFPLLFIPFVENAFKHGTHPTKECFVHIGLSTTPDRLFFEVRNSVIVNRKVVKTGIGIKNTIRRLELLFPDRHELNILKNDSFHLVELNIKL